MEEFKDAMKRLMEKAGVTQEQIDAINNEELEAEKREAYMMRAEALENQVEYEAQIRRRKAEKIFSKSGLGGRFRKRTFDTLDVNDGNKKAAETARRFVMAFPEVDKGVFISGVAGTGKTHIAGAIANALIGELHVVVFGNITDIISSIKRTYSKDSDITEADIIHQLTEETDLLIIDDLGKENATGNTISLLYQIVNKLYENEKPVIITTNYTPKMLIEKYGETGEAIMSRLAEMTYPVKITGEDRRFAEW